jgi:hypothetical protein
LAAEQVGAIFSLNCKPVARLFGFWLMALALGLAIWQAGAA